jgi:hypothetical protein
LAGSSLGTTLQDLVNQGQKNDMRSKLAQSKQLFMENKGQWSRSAKFAAQYPGLNVWITDKGWKLDQREASREPRQSGHVVEVSFVGANKNLKSTGLLPGNARTDFLIGTKRALGVKQYGEVLMDSVYEGIAARWYVQAGKPRFDFIVEPGASPSKIQMKLAGAEAVQIQNGSELIVKTSVGQIRQADLKAFQVIEGERVMVPVEYQIVGKDTVGFKVGAYDRSHDLIIDPLVYGSYYGGDSGFDEVHAVAADADFGVFVTGYTQAPDFPAISGPYGFALNGTRDMFISKFQGDAYNHDYSAYIGGSGSEVGQYMGLSPDGTKVWIAGTTDSADFPEVGGGLFPTRPGGTTDIFVMRFTKDEEDVLIPDYSTYYGTSGTEILRAMAVAPITGEVVLAGDTNGGLPTKSNSYLGGTTDAFMCRFTVDANGISGIKHCWYVGGTGRDTCAGMAVDSNDNVIIGGTVFNAAVVDTAANPAVFETTPGVFANGRLLRQTDAFIRKYDTNGNIVYSAVLGGNSNDTALAGGYAPLTGSPVFTGNGVAVDPAGNAYITGISTSFNFPRTPGVFGENFSFEPVIFATKINQDGSQIVYSTHLQTQRGVQPAGIAVDARGTAYITGNIFFTLGFPVPPGDPNQPQSVSFGTIPTTPDALDNVHESPNPPELPTTEGFMLVLTPTATSLLHGTFIGGILDDQIYAPYVDRFGDVWTVGGTDVGRYYERVSSTLVVTRYLPTGPRRGTLPGALLSPFGFKLTPDPTNMLTATTVSTPYGILESPFTAPAFINCLLWRDGFLVKQRLTLPTITGINLNPADVAGGLGATSQGTITLSGPVPAGGLDITVTLNNAAASFSASALQDTLVINVPGGATTANFTIFTNPVTAPTQVQVRATLEGNFFIRVLTVEPWLQQLSLTPNTVVGGNTITGRVRLWQPAISDTVVDLTTDASGLVTFPNGNTVTVPAGVDSATFTIQTHGVGPQTDVPVTASLLGVGKTEFVRLLAANLATVTFDPVRVTSGTPATGTVTLDGEAGPAFTVDLSILGSPAGYSLNPVQVTFNPGDRSKTFVINTAYEPTNTQRSVIATRTAQGPYTLQSISGTLFVDAATLISFTLDPTTIDPGQSSTGTVTINVPAATGGAVIGIASDNPIVTVPAQVVVPGGAAQATFQATASNVALANDTVVNITATRGPVNIVQQLTVLASEATLVISPNNVLGGNNASATISVPSPAGPGGLTFNLSSDSGAATVPPTVTIPEGQTSVNFTINTINVMTDTVATITATSGMISAQATLLVRAISVIDIKFVPSRVRGGQQTTMTVTIDAPAPVGGATVNISTSDPSLTTNLPSSVTVLEGQTSRSVNVLTRRVSRTLATQVSASYGSSARFTILTVTR